MEPRQLATLRELRDRGSITAVATALRVTPSSVSQQLSALQRSAGVRLTRLDGRRTVLTDAGQALAAAAVDVEVALARARDAVNSFAADRTTISLAAFPTAAISLFPRLLADPDPGLPVVRFADEGGSAEDFARLTLSYDLVIGHRLHGSPPWPATLSVTPLLTEPLDLVCRVGHPLTELDAVGLADLVRTSWLGAHEGAPLEDAVRRLAGAGGRDPAVTHHIDDLAVTAALLRRTDDVTLVPRHLATLPRGLVAVPFRDDLGASLTRRVDVLARPEVLARAGTGQVVDALLRASAELTTATQ